jgi:hypothetical protein
VLKYRQAIPAPLLAQRTQLFAVFDNFLSSGEEAGHKLRLRFHLNESEQSNLDIPWLTISGPEFFLTCIPFFVSIKKCSLIVAR